MAKKKRKRASTPEHTVCVDEEHKADADRRLRRIEGQVRGIQQMIKDDRDCVDVLAQVSAVNAGMRWSPAGRCGTTSATASATR